MDQETFRTSQHLLETDGQVHARFMYFNHLLRQAIAEESRHYICPGLQCLVLGDSQVGKTSFVRSLTGERFATEQTKTPRIEERIVDKEWNTREFTKDHATGKFIPYFKETLVRSMSFGRDRKEPLSDSTKLDYMAVLMMIFLYGYQIKRLVSVMLHYALLSMLVLLSFFAYFVVHRKSICQPITEVSDLHICSYPLWIIDQMYTERNSSIWGNCVSCSHDSLLKCDFRNTAVLEDYSFLICSKHHVTRSCGTSLVAP